MFKAEIGEKMAKKYAKIKRNENVKIGAKNMQNFKKKRNIKNRPNKSQNWGKSN